MSSKAQLHHALAFWSHSSATIHLQCQTVVPTCRKVPHFHLFVASSLPLTPEQQALLCAEPLLVDVTDGEAQNQSPYQTQYDLPVSIHHILCPNVCHLYPSCLDEIKRLVDIFKLLDTKLRSSRIPSQRFVSEDFEEMYQNDL